MSTRNYYVLCDDNCKFEGMTKEQILTAIYEATGVLPEDIDDAIITKIQEQNASAAVYVWKGTEAQFNALATVRNDTIYFVANGAAVFKDTEELEQQIAQMEEAIEDIEGEIEDLQGEVQPVSRGGTGATSASDARSNLELGSVATENTVPISKGGTGATSASDARNAIGAAASSHTHNAYNDITSLGSMFSVQTYNVSNKRITEGYNTDTITVSLSGYSPVALAGFSFATTDESNVSLDACHLDRNNSKVWYQLTKRDSGADYANIYIYILFVKN